MEQKENEKRHHELTREEALRTVCVSRAQELHKRESYVVVECCFHKETLYYSQLTRNRRCYLTIRDGCVDIVCSYYCSPNVIYKASMYCIYTDNSLLFQSIFDNIERGYIHLTPHTRPHFSRTASPVAECADWMGCTVNEFIRSMDEGYPH